MSYEGGFKSDSTKMGVVIIIISFIFTSRRHKHVVINDRSLRLIRRGQRIARIGEMIMMSHVSVSQLGWAELCWAAGGKSNKSRN